MKKTLKDKIIMLGLAVLLLTAGMMSGCNKQIIDLTYEYDYAIISLPNGEVVEGEVKSWTDYADGDQIQVKIDGVQYLVHSSNVVLYRRAEAEEKPELTWPERNVD